MKTSRGHPLPAPAPTVITIAVILAGGLSTRMGRDKGRTRLEGITLVDHARAAASRANLPVLVVRRDAVARCGPLGGVLTALRAGVARRFIFLACDQPFVGATTLRRLMRFKAGAFFEDESGVACFPFSLGPQHQVIVDRLIRRGTPSLQRLAATIRARRLRISRRNSWRWFNVNQPEDLSVARAFSRVLGMQPGD